MKKKDKSTQKIIDVLQGNVPSSKSFGWTPDNDPEYAKFKKEKSNKKKQERAETNDILQTIRMPWFCPKCKHIMSAKVDKKMWAIHGTCMICVSKLETELKTTGKFEDYQKEKMIRNSISYLKDYKLKFQEALTQSARQTYFNDDGSEEHWDMPEDQLTKIKKDISNDIVKIDESVQNLEKELEEFLITKV